MNHHRTLIGYDQPYLDHSVGVVRLQMVQTTTDCFETLITESALIWPFTGVYSVEQTNINFIELKNIPEKNKMIDANLP